MSSVIEQAETEIDNLRAAFGWSRENSDVELALALASSLQPLWQARGRLREGLAWFDAALADLDAQHPEVAAAVRARALADRALLAVWVGAADSLDQAQQALAIAREVDDPALLARALTACGFIAASSTPRLARPYFAEAIGLARALGDRWRLSQILAWQASAAISAGDPIAVRAAAEEGRDLAEAIGDRFRSRQCRWCLGVAQVFQGDLAGAAAQFGEVVAEAEAAHDGLVEADSLAVPGHACWRTRVTRVRPGPPPTRPSRPPPSWAGSTRACAYAALAAAALAAGDVATAQDAIEAWPHLSALPQTAAVQRVDQCAGRAGGRGSGRGPPLGRRRRRDDDGLLPVGGADHARPRGDRAR